MTAVEWAVFFVGFWVLVSAAAAFGAAWILRRYPAVDPLVEEPRGAYQWWLEDRPEHPL